MTVTFQSAVSTEDYHLIITLSNTNQIEINMFPYFSLAQFSTLKEKEIWANPKVQDDRVYWKNGVQLSISALLSLLHEEGFDSGIACANAGDDWRLFLRLKNGNSLSIDVEPLLEYSVFAPLVQEKLWKSLLAKEYSLLWVDESIRLEMPMDTILNYFA